MINFGLGTKNVNLCMVDLASEFCEICTLVLFISNHMPIFVKQLIYVHASIDVIFKPF